MESFVDTPEGRGTVVEIDLLRQRVKVRMEDAPETISVFANADIAVLRSGKAKKNDPPIPADLAPISGNGKRVRKEPENEEKLLLEPIRFRYSTEKIVEETEEEVQELTEEAGEKPGRSRNRRRKPNKPAAEEQPKQEPKAEKPKKEPKELKEPKEPKAEEGGEAKPRRRPNHRRRKPGNKPSGEGQQ